MKKADTSSLTISPQDDFSSTVVIGRKKYHVVTDRSSTKSCSVITQIYYKGEIITSKKSDFPEKMNSPDAETRLYDYMYRQHHMVMDQFINEKGKEIKTPSAFLDEVESFLKKDNFQNALDVLTCALDLYPDDPLLLSYFGCLEAIMNRKYSFGIETCLKAIKIFKRKSSIGEEHFHPVLYLNLGRAYLAAGKRKEAFDTFRKGLGYDSYNKELLNELSKLGVRTRPVIPFLKRSHPVNKYIGKLLHKVKK
jgi:tetratricopeptide (TPR) repeat protein